VATAVATQNPGEPNSPIVIAGPDLKQYLGPVKYFPDATQRTGVPGVATGLSWTSAGGNVLFIEAAIMSGGKGLTLTGQLGDVMKESAQAALSYIRSQAQKLDIDPHFFDQHDLHIHVPAGAIPKDGPSAGVTIATALASLLTGRPVREDVGMTGEISLQGQLLPIGGLKEKVLAAHRAGLKTIILPRQNEQDLENIPQEVKQELEFFLAQNLDEVLATALQDFSNRQGT